MLLLLDVPSWIQPHDQFGAINAEAGLDWDHTRPRAATSIPDTLLDFLFVLLHEIEHINSVGISSDFHDVIKAAQLWDQELLQCMAVTSGCL